MANLKLFVFGPPRLERGGAPVELNLRKALALFVYLAVSGQPHARDALATMLWPESDGREGRARLRRTLHRLNEAVGDDIIEGGAEVIRLRPAADLWLDSAAFRQHVTAGPHDVAAPERLAHLAAAVALHGEDFLHGFTLPDSPAFDEWQFFQREGLRQLCGQVLEQLVQAHRAQSNWEEAIAYARRWLALDALYEPAHRTLMRLYASAGQHTAALRQFQECARLLEAELGVAPEDETSALFEAIRTRQFAPEVERAQETPSAPQPQRPHRIPTPGTPLVGRKRERAEIAALLGRDEVRLVTLTGPGGVGKTRLALAVADALRETFPDGVIVVGLQSLADEALVLPTIAQALDVAEHGDTPLLASVTTALEGRRVLLVLDNFEQVLGAVVRVAELLLGAPTLKVLATSRAALRVRAEHVIVVEPLSAPVSPLPPGELFQYEAVQLFAARAQAAKAGFEITGANAPAVAAICSHLDGLPLAIELAATRVRILAPEALYQRLEKRLDLLTGGARDLPERQQTLRATIDWSYWLLRLDEQRLLDRLSVFVGGWTLEAAEIVCAEESGDLDVLDGLQALIEQSLVQQADAPGGEPRFSMLETVREYAQERLKIGGESAAVQRRHTYYYLALAEQAEAQLEAAHSALWLGRLEAEHNNLRAALQGVLERGENAVALRLAGALWRFWQIRGHFSEGRAWLDKALNADARAPREPGQRAKVLMGAGTMAWAQTDFAAAGRFHEQALHLYREVGDKQGIATALNYLAAQLINQGETERAQPLFYESLELHRAVGDDTGVVNALCNLGVVALGHGEYARSVALSEEALAISLATGNNFTTANLLSNMALAHMQQGKRERAAELFREGLRLFAELGDTGGMAECLEGLALPIAETEPTQFAQLFALAEHQRASVGMLRPPYQLATYRSYIAAARSHLSEAAWDAAMAQGRAMTIQQALAWQLGKP